MGINHFVQIMDQINLTEDKKEKILQNCRENRHVSNKLLIYSKQIAVASVVALLSFTSITAYAAVNAYQEYMSRMSKKEIEARFGELQQGGKNADSFSRALSEGERNRMQELILQYQQGIQFPQNSMDRCEGEKVQAVSKPYYDYVNMIFYIPERELTDEEILQIIDVWEKANYSLSLKNEDNVDTNNDISDEEVIQDTKDFMEQYMEEVVSTDEAKIKVFIENTINYELSLNNEEPISLEEFDYQITLYGDQIKKYWVVAENDLEKYSIFFTKDSSPDKLTVETYNHFTKDFSDMKEISIEEKKNILCEQASVLTDFLSKYMGIDSQIVKKEIYNDNYLVLTDVIGNRYRINVNFENGRIAELLTYRVGEYDDIDLTGEILE